MKKAFTLIELIATIVILGIVTSIVSILIMNVIRNVKDSARKRSIDNYGRIIETSMAEYQSQYLKYPDSIDQLEIEYVGSVIECETRRINPDKTIYLSECKVNGKKVLDKSTEDGYYHYGTLVLTNEEYVDKLGKNIEVALKDYYEENNKYPVNYRLLNLPTLDKDVNCVSEIHQDGTVYLTKCSIDGSYILNESEEDGYYHYGKEIPTAVKYLLKKTNPITVTNYTDGDIHEMYTFEHEATEQTPALTDYRYIGSDPNNYVEFNNELWRIIGVFSVEDENGNWEERVKIIRDESLDNKQWNTSRVNEWVDSTMQVYLSDTYIIADKEIYINNVKYYLGATTNYGVDGYNIYNQERGRARLNDTRSLNWIGKIALLYQSDYIFTYAYGVDSICFTKMTQCSTGNPSSGWLYSIYKKSWLINPYATNGGYVAAINENGNSVNLSLASGGGYHAVPTLYLSLDIKITLGDGTIDNPYQLSL